ncbi:MAG: lysostaphin resistance A-like protein [Luteolibacter sp.]
MNASNHHTALADLAAGPLNQAGGNVVNPALWVVGGTFLLGIAWALVAASVRRMGNRCDRQVGRVDPSHHRPVDLIGSGWIVGIYLWLSLAQIVAAASLGEERTIGVADLWVSIAFQCVMAGMVMLAMTPRVSPIDWLGLRRLQWRELVLFAPLAVVAMWMLFAILQAFGYTGWLESLEFDTMQESVRALQNQNDISFRIWMGFSAIVVAPICEEVVFRGYLYGVAKRYGGPFAAAISSALIFSAAHGSVAALLPLAIFGLLLAWLYERSGSIWPPVAAHAFFNTATVLVLMSQ